MTETIYTVDASDHDLLDLYSRVDRGSGEAFADENCVELVDGWREIASAEIARARKRGEVE